MDSDNLIEKIVYKQMTFSEKIIESDLIQFKNTGDIKHYKSAKCVSEQENAPYIFNSIRKQLLEESDLALKIYLYDSDYWSSFQLLMGNNFSFKEILDALIYIFEHIDSEEFKTLSSLAVKKLFKYILIDANDFEVNVEKSKEKNLFIQVALSFFNLQNLKSSHQISIWERNLEKTFIKDNELAESFHKYWKFIEDYFNEITS